MKVSGLWNLVGLYLEEMETNCPGAGAGSLELISEGVSRDIWGETKSLRTLKDKENNSIFSVNNDYSWAGRADSWNLSAAINSRRKPLTKPNRLQGQSYEDIWVIIRLEYDHESYKVEYSLRRQKNIVLIISPFTYGWRHASAFRRCRIRSNIS